MSATVACRFGGRLTRAGPLALALGIALLGGGASARAATMQAVVVRRAQIRVEAVARPVAAPGEVLVQLHYASVNPGDWKIAMGGTDGASGLIPGTPLPPGPMIPGFDGSGVVAALGAGVTTVHVGDPVIVWSRRHGTYAQFVAVPATAVAPMPERLSFAEAAGLAHAGLAAWNLLVDVAHVQAHQSVLVTGGAGGVGSAAVQIAKIRGARVIATASGRNVQYLQSLGADDVIDYTQAHFEERLRNIDVALNTVDADNANRALAVIRRGGYLVALGGLPPPDRCAAHGVICSGRSAHGAPTSTALKQIAGWAEQGKFRVNVDRTFALSEITQAWQYSQAGHTRGKCVIKISD